MSSEFQKTGRRAKSKNPIILRLKYSVLFLYRNVAERENEFEVLLRSNNSTLLPSIHKLKECLHQRNMNGGISFIVPGLEDVFYHSVARWCSIPLSSPDMADLS
jgi:hypothetical protein